MAEVSREKYKEMKELNKVLKTYVKEASQKTD
jgi:hypothetical protein